MKIKYSKYIPLIIGLIATIVVCVNVVSISFLHADTIGGAPTKTITLKNPLSDKFDSVGGLFQQFIVIFSYIAILLAVLALIWVGLQFILARGNSAKMVELKNWLKWIVVGVAVIIGARIIIQVVINTLAATGTVDQRTINSAQKAVGGN